MHFETKPGVDELVTLYAGHDSPESSEAEVGDDPRYLVHTLLIHEVASVHRVFVVAYDGAARARRTVHTGEQWDCRRNRAGASTSTSRGRLRRIWSRKTGAARNLVDARQRVGEIQRLSTVRERPRLRQLILQLRF